MKMIYAIVIVWVMISAAGQANADVSGTGPHNENGNATMDYYWNANFHGSMQMVLDDFNNTPRFASAPKARRVYTKEEADVWIHWESDASPAWFSHREGVDEIGINPNVDGGKTGTKVFTHETAHSYSEQHMTDEECAKAIGGSVMCPRFWNPHHLTLTDNMFLRKLPNEFQGMDQRDGSTVAE